MSLSVESFAEKIVYQQLCMFSEWKRQRQPAPAYLWHSNLCGNFFVRLPLPQNHVHICWYFESVQKPPSSVQILHWNVFWYSNMISRVHFFRKIKALCWRVEIVLFQVYENIGSLCQLGVKAEQELYISSCDISHHIFDISVQYSAYKSKERWYYLTMRLAADQEAIQQL